MKLSKAAQIIYDYIWVDGQPRGTSFIIGDTYNVDGVEFKTSENTYEELEKYREESSRPYRVIRTGKVVNVMGGRLA